MKNFKTIRYEENSFQVPMSFQTKEQLNTEQKRKNSHMGVSSCGSCAHAMHHSKNVKYHTSKLRCVEQRKVIINIKIDLRNNNNKRPRSNIGTKYKAQNQKQQIKRRKKTH